MDLRAGHLDLCTEDRSAYLTAPEATVLKKPVEFQRQAVRLA